PTQRTSFRPPLSCSLRSKRKENVMHSPRERLIRYLDDAWAVEKAQVAALDDAADKLHANGLRTMLKEQRQTAPAQEENIEEKIRAFGEEPTTSKSFLSKLLAKIGEGLHEAEDEYDAATQTVLKEYAALHFKRAMYDALRSYAEVVDETDIANLASRYADQAL